jgi:hypothetical protein
MRTRFMTILLVLVLAAGVGATVIVAAPQSVGACGEEGRPAPC